VFATTRADDRSRFVATPGWCYRLFPRRLQVLDRLWIFPRRASLGLLEYRSLLIFSSGYKSQVRWRQRSGKKHRSQRIVPAISRQYVLRKRIPGAVHPASECEDIFSVTDVKWFARGEEIGRKGRGLVQLGEERDKENEVIRA